MNLNNLILAVTPLSKQICLGRPNKACNKFLEKIDFTEQVYTAVIDQMLQSEVSSKTITIGKTTYKLTLEETSK